MTMLTGYRVLDLTDERGALCGKLFADLGAEVIGVEPPGGNSARTAPPYGKNGESLFWAAYGAGRRSLVLDLAHEKDREAFGRLAEGADFVVESFPPGHLEALGLGYEALRRLNPGLILVSISPYGQTGPYARYRASDLTVWSMGGHTYVCGDADRPPVRVTAPQTWLHAAAEAVVGALIALNWRESGGTGQWVDVSAQQCVAWTLQIAQAMAQPEYGGMALRRVGIYFTSPYGVNVRSVFRCKDGFVAFLPLGGAAFGVQLNAAVRVLDREGFANDFLRGRDWTTWDFARFVDDQVTAQKEVNAVEEAFSAWFLTHTMEELYDLAIAEGLLLAPVFTPRELYRSPQLNARAFWQPVDLGPSGTLRFPGPFAKATGRPLAPPRPAPALPDGATGRRGDVAWATADRGRPATRAARGDAPSQALQGLKVADFSWVGVGPAGAKYLADYGATVVHVECSTRPDVLRLVGPFPAFQPGLNRAWWFNDVNMGKLGITLDLNKPRAREVAERLVRWADVLLESYTAGTMAKWGLDYEQIRRLNPRIIMISATQQGQTGPHASYAGYGNLLQATAGFKNLVGWPDREPVGPYLAYTDFVCHRFVAAAVLAALAHRQRTGEGQYLDLSQLEASLQFLAPYLLAYDATGEVPVRDGNRDPRAAPHGVFPCSGDDRWIALACWDDADWRRLADLIGEPWAAEPAYATLAGRKAGEAALEERLAAWTARQEARALFERLQAAGLDAGLVQSAADLLADPQLAHRRHYQRFEHPETGAALYDGFASQLSATPGALRIAPCLGQHNAQVYREILGYSDDEIADFVASGVIN